jgi:hypothetical protein
VNPPKWIEDFMTDGVTNLNVQRLACDEEKRKRIEKYSAASLKSGLSGIEAAECRSRKNLWMLL